MHGSHILRCPYACSEPTDPQLMVFQDHLDYLIFELLNNVSMPSIVGTASYHLCGRQYARHGTSNTLLIKIHDDGMSV